MRKIIFAITLAGIVGLLAGCCCNPCNTPNPCNPCSTPCSPCGY